MPSHIIASSFFRERHFGFDPYAAPATKTAVDSAADASNNDLFAESDRAVPQDPAILVAIPSAETVKAAANSAAGNSTGAAWSLYGKKRSVKSNPKCDRHRERKHNK